MAPRLSPKVLLNAGEMDSTADCQGRSWLTMTPLE